MEWFLNPPQFFVMTFWICVDALVIGLTAALLWHLACWCFGV